MRRLAPVLLFAVLSTWLLSPSILGGKVMGGEDALMFLPPFDSARPAELRQPSNGLLFDATYVFHPDQQFVRREVRGGRLPGWTPYQSAGRPLLAAQQSAPLFPLNSISYVLPYWRSLAFIAALKLIVAALGTLLLCRALALGRGPAVMGGVAFAFSAYMVSWLSHPHDNVYILFPWLLLTIDRVCRRGRLPDALALAAVVGLSLLGGHPETVVVLAPALVAWTLYRLASHRGGGEGLAPLARRSAVLVGAVLVGFAIGAVMVLPLIEALSESYSTTRGMPGLPLRALYSFQFPGFWGRSDHFLEPGEPINYAERAAYVGALPLLLAAAGLVARRPRGPQIFFAVLAAIGVPLAYNLGSPSHFLTGLPGLRFADMDRFVVVIALALSVLGAYGLQAAMGGDRKSRLRMLAMAAVVGLVPGVGWMVRHLSSLPPQKETLHYLPNLTDIPPSSADAVEFAAVLRWSALAGLLLLLLVVLALRPAWSRLLAPVCVVLVAVDLVSLGRGYQSSIEPSAAQPPVPPTVAYMQRSAGSQRMAAEGDAFGPNVPSRYGLRDVRGHELPVVARQQRLFHVLGGGGFQRASIELGMTRTAQLLDVFAVRHVLAPTATKPRDPSLRPVYRAGGQTVFENRDAFPRAWVAYGFRSAQSENSALAHVFLTPPAQLREAPVIEGGPRSAERPRERSTPAQVASDDPSSVRLDVRAKRDGWLILDDTYYPGWKATVDGNDAAIKRANSTFRAVRVPAGRHHVTFEYRSGVLRAGWILSLLGGVLLLAGSVLVLVRCRARVPADPPPR